MYRTQALTDAQNRHLIGSIKNLSKVNSEAEVIVVGDLNLPDVCWVSGTVEGPIGTSNKTLCLQQLYMDFITEEGLTWHITDEKTRVRLVNGIVQKSTLDQVLSSNSAIVNNISMLSPLGKSDHSIISVDLNVDVKKQKDFMKSTKVLWGKVNQSDILKLAEGIDWQYPTESSEINVEAVWKDLKFKLFSVSDQIPSCGTNSFKANRVPWECTALKRYRREKDKSWAVFDSTPTAQNLSLALHRQSRYEESEVSAKVKYEKKITASLKHSSKPFFSYLRSKRKAKVTVSSLKRDDSSETVGAEETAQELSSFFSSVFTQETYGPLEQKCYKRISNYSEIGDISFSFEDVQKVLEQIKIDKSPGPDQIHPKLLKSLASDPKFVDSVYKLFICCAESRQIPSDWKLANVIALHKKGPRNRAENYRPVSLTSILCKLYEKLVKTHIFNHVEDKLSLDQHGFVGGRSCTSNLLEAFDTILDMIDDGLPVDVLFFDFKKAFDTVPHYRLLVKLESFGINGSTLEIISDFLSDRRMRVGVGDKFSQIFRIVSGVPQGSVLGPLLFLLFINDLPNNIRNKVFMFADDLKLVADATNINDISSDLIELENWEDLWQLRFNASKCKVMHLQPNENPCLEYRLNNVVLETVEYEKDLGLTVSNTLKWDEHIKNSLSKANQTIAWVSRNIICKTKEVMSMIYRCIVRPHLEYCVQAWSPTPRHGNWDLILKIEKVQRKFTCLINDIGTLTYGARLKSLKLTTLAERRIRGDLIETFKIVTGLVNYGQNMFRVSRSGCNLVSKGIKVSRARQDFFGERVIQYWNLLPAYVKESPSVDSFKINLELYKNRTLALADQYHRVSTGHFWGVSEHVLSRIETPSAVASRPAFCTYLQENSWIAKRKGINIYKASGA